jgi:hypothetical protein
LLLTDFYRELNKIAEIVYFNNEKTFEHVRPDAICGFVYNGINRLAFIETEKSFKGVDLNKYKKLKATEQYKKYFKQDFFSLSRNIKLNLTIVLIYRFLKTCKINKFSNILA